MIGPILAMLAVVLFLVLVAGRSVPLISHWRRRFYLRSQIADGPRAHWLRGNVPHDLTTSKQHYMALANAMPRMFIFWYGSLLSTVSLTHPETVANAIRSGPGKFHLVYDMFKPWLGNGLFTSDGKRWARDRRLMSHVFTASMLKEYVSVYKEACSVMLDLWHSNQKKSIDVGTYLSTLTFDVILKCVTGLDSNCQTDTDPNSRHRRYLLDVEETASLVLTRFRQLWNWSDFVYYRTADGRRFAELCVAVHSFGMQVIRKRREELKEVTEADIGHKPQAKNMLDILLNLRDENGVGMSDVEIREQVDTFLFAGRDTTAAVLHWALYYMIEYAAMQEKCRAEVTRVMEECGGPDGFHHEHIGQLQYLGQFVKETLRHSSILPTVGRSLTHEAVVDGVKLPAGTNVQINVLGVHYNRQVWHHPETFDPHRFAPGQGPSHPYAFIPFLVGSRNCIGKHFAQDELKVVLAMILLKFVLLPDPDAEVPHWRQVAVARPYPTLRIRIRATT